MFDPHRTRHNDRRYFTRKGQVIQAKSITPPFSIERNKVGAYKEYIRKNRLLTPPPQALTTIDSIYLGIATNSINSSARVKLSQFTVLPDDGDTINFGDGLHLVIYITPESDSWDLECRILGESSFRFYDGGWYAYYTLPSDTTSVAIYFDTIDSKHLFNADLISDTQYSQAVADIEIYRAFYNLPLPARPYD